MVDDADAVGGSDLESETPKYIGYSKQGQNYITPCCSRTMVGKLPDFLAANIEGTAATSLTKRMCK